MTLKEAIKILTEEQKDHHSFPTDIIGKAELLSIEALKWVKDVRHIINTPNPELLPGETKD